MSNSILIKSILNPLARVWKKTNALGLGTFFSGFFVRAAQNNSDIKKLLEIKEGKQIALCMVIGYPAVTYYRTVPRNEADISWK